jgi:hypothetical protein
LYDGFPVIGTETLWEGQPRGNNPLELIWGVLTAGGHTVPADWSYEDPVNIIYGSIGRGWIPVKSLGTHIFRTTELGVDTDGDEYYPIAMNALEQFEYWKMTPDNSLVSGGAEAYCLTEVGRQYLVYAPDGGTVSVDLSTVSGRFFVEWLDPSTGDYVSRPMVNAGGIRTFESPSAQDYVLMLVLDEITTTSLQSSSVGFGSI